MPVTTPNMSLTIPSVGDTTPGYATSIASSLTAVDAHDHSAGKGVAIKAANLTWGGVVDAGLAQLQGLATTRFTDQAAASSLPAASYPRALFTVAGDLWYNTGGGLSLQLTSGGVLNGALVGGIVGAYASSGASVSYNSTTKAYTFLDQNSANAGLVASTGSFSGTVSAFGSLTVTGALTALQGVVATPVLTKTYRVSPFRGFWPNGVSTAPTFPNPPIRVSFPASSTGRWYVGLPIPNMGYISAIRIRMYGSGSNVSGSCFINGNSTTSGATSNTGIGGIAWPTTPTGDFVLTYTAASSSTMPCPNNMYWIDFGASQGASSATVAIVGIEFDVAGLSQLPDTLV